VGEKTQPQKRREKIQRNLWLRKNRKSVRGESSQVLFNPSERPNLKILQTPQSSKSPISPGKVVSRGKAPWRGEV